MPYKDIKNKRANDHRAWLKLKAQGTTGQAPIGVVKNLGIKVPKDGLKIAVIPDVQAMPGVSFDHLNWCGQYLRDKQPDVIACMGDFGDFPSLSHFDRGTLQFEGRRYKKDLAAFHKAMETFMAPLTKYYRSDKWRPRLEFIMGNHEDHIRRAVNEDPKLEGLMSTDDLRLADYGWRVHEFLQPVAVGGVAFCHYFPSGVMGRPITTAQALLTKLHMSAFAGHQQGRQIAYGKRADGADMTAIISGSFYQHSYEYLSPFTNRHWRGFYVLHEVRDGQFDEMAISIDFLRRRYGH